MLIQKELIEKFLAQPGMMSVSVANISFTSELDFDKLTFVLEGKNAYSTISDIFAQLTSLYGNSGDDTYFANGQQLLYPEIEVTLYRDQEESKEIAELLATNKMVMGAFKEFYSTAFNFICDLLSDETRLRLEIEL